MMFTIRGNELVISCPHGRAHEERYPIAEAGALLDLAKSGAFTWTCPNEATVEVSAQTARNLVEFLGPILANLP